MPKFGDILKSVEGTYSLCRVSLKDSLSVCFLTDVIVVNVVEYVVF